MTEEFIYIPVPKRWSDAVYARLGELSGQASDGSPESHTIAKEGGATANAVGSGDAQVALDVAPLRRMYNESYEQHRRLIAFLAEHPGDWHYTGDLARALDLQNGARGLAGMLGAFGRRAKHRYGGMTPWQSEWDPNRAEMRHRMDPKVAETVRNLRNELGET